MEKKKISVSDTQARLDREIRIATVLVVIVAFVGVVLSILQLVSR